MKSTASRERTGMLVGLGFVLAVASFALVRDDIQLVVSPWLLAALVFPAAAFSAFLRTHLDTWGREGKYLDYWSIPHFLVGVFGFLLGIDLIYVAAIAAAWELVELAARVRETTHNRITDVVLAVVGWLFMYLISARDSW